MQIFIVLCIRAACVVTISMLAMQKCMKTVLIMQNSPTVTVILSMQYNNYSSNQCLGQMS